MDTVADTALNLCVKVARQYSHLIQATDFSMYQSGSFDGWRLHHQATVPLQELIS